MKAPFAFFGSAPAPTVSSCTPNKGLNTGGDTITVTGTNFVSGATVTINGVSASMVSVTNSTTLTCLTNSDSTHTGLVNVVVTNPSGKFGTGTNVFTLVKNMNLLSLTAFFLGANYNTGTGAWTGTASAGTSSGKNGSVPGGYGTPDAGTALNGLATVRYVAANLDATEVGAASSTFISNSTSSCFALVNVVSIATNNANLESDAPIFSCVGAYHGMVLRSTPTVNGYVYDGSYKYIPSGVAISTGTWMLVSLIHSGGTMSLAVNGGTAATASAGNISNVSSALRLGTEGGGSFQFNGSIAMIAFSNTDLTAEIANVKAYCNLIWNLSL